MAAVVNEKPTLWWLLHVYNWLKGGAGEGVGLLGGSGLGNLLPKRLGEAAPQELSARPELLVILGIL